MPLWIAAALAVALAVGAASAIGTLRGASRLQRRLFWTFLSLASIPTVLVLWLDWRMSGRQLEVLDSAGFRASMESSLDLARRVLDAQRLRTQALAESLAAQAAVTSGLPPLEGGILARLEQPETTDRSSGERSEHGGRTYLCAVVPVEVAGQRRALVVERPLDPALAADLDAIAGGSRSARQLRLFYGKLLRGDVVLTLLGTGAVLLTVSLLLSRLLTRRIAGPISALAAGMEVVAAGNLDHRVRVRAVDEVGDLVEAFNRMTAELQESKQTVVRTARIAAWQGVARRLAHEIKNPLTPIGLAAHRIRQRTSDATVLECLDTLLEETGNLRRLADEFSEFARLPEPQRAPVDLEAILRAVVELYADRDALQVRWIGWEGAPPVQGDAGLLRQVFANLVKNAVEAMDGRGELVLRAEREDGRLRVSVQDGGAGLPQDAGRIFEAGFTTKPGGTGLGLAIVQKIVADHGGRVSAHALTPRGAELRVELPVDTAAAPGPPDDRRGAPHGQEAAP
jgi:nitrogen fixation/metabolism regulation signal transduction histidine kinase